MQNKNTIGKKGRKLGTTDSVNVSIATLLKHLKPETVVPVRRKWLEATGELLNVVFIEAAVKLAVASSEVSLTEENLDVETVEEQLEDENATEVRERLELPVPDELFD